MPHDSEKEQAEQSAMSTLFSDLNDRAMKQDRKKGSDRDAEKRNELSRNGEEGVSNRWLQSVSALAPLSVYL